MDREVVESDTRRNLFAVVKRRKAEMIVCTKPSFSKDGEAVPRVSGAQNDHKRSFERFPYSVQRIMIYNLRLLISISRTTLGVYAMFLQQLQYEKTMSFGIYTMFCNLPIKSTSIRMFHMSHVLVSLPYSLASSRTLGPLTQV